MDVGWMWGGRRVDVGWMWGGCQIRGTQGTKT